MHIIIIKANNIFVSYNETSTVYFILIVKEQGTIKYNKFYQNAEQKIRLAFSSPVGSSSETLVIKGGGLHAHLELHLSLKSCTLYICS
jgi:hypothetical protein